MNNDTVSGMTGHTQGVKMVSRPPRKHIAKMLNRLRCKGTGESLNSRSSSMMGLHSGDVRRLEISWSS